MALQRDTVAIPFSSGVKPRVRARLLPADKLLTAQNCFFSLDNGPEKRFGHAAKTVRTSGDFPGLNGTVLPTAAPFRETYATTNPSLSSSWLYGWGIDDGVVAATTDPFEVSKQPYVGQLFGTTTRDNETIAWDGHRLFSYAVNQPSRYGETLSGSGVTALKGPSCLPVLRSQVFAKLASSQTIPDAADNGMTRLASWLNSDGTVGYALFDSTTGASLISGSFSFTTAKSVRCLSVDGWFHILVSDSGANSLEMRSFNQETPNLITSRSLGTVDNQFDVKKISESRFVVIKSKAGVISCFVLQQDGGTLSSFTPALGGFAASTNLAIACETDAQGNIGIAWLTTGAPVTVSFATYTQGGAVATARQQVATITLAQRLTLSPRVKSIAATMWDVFVEDTVGVVNQVRTYCVQAGTSSTLLATRHRMSMGSHAFRVGNRNFVWLASWFSTTPVFQATWFLCDTALLPVGKHDYGTANPDYGTSLNTCFSVNWHIDLTNPSPFKDRVVFHGALSFKQRVPSLTTTLSGTPNGVFAEPSIKFYELDFLPRLRSGQAGRTTYVAGAQLWAFDGQEVVESGFHMTPETPTGVLSGGGALSTGTYRYRVDLCHKNAQNEEVRSWSIISAALSATAGDKVTLTIPTMPMTRKEDAYFLVFRTAVNSSVYYLVSSRDSASASYVKNTLSVASVTLVDSLADSSVSGGEQYPANASSNNYVDPLPAPACEVISAGRDRLWLAGGELSAGEVAPSRLFFPGQAPAFSPLLNIQVDRNAEPITAVGFVGDLTIFFRKTSIYLLDSDGPDNFVNTAWPQPRRVLGDVGAVGQEGVALTLRGLWFQATAGLRLLGAGGQLLPEAGMEMDPVTSGAVYSASVVVPQFTQVRWYSRQVGVPTIILDYATNDWTTWTVDCVGATFSLASNLAILGKGDGNLWVETEGLYTDAGSGYEMIVRTSWLHGQALGDFQRVRRFALFGESSSTHQLRARVYYDERPFWEEEFVRNFPNSALFGNDAWGDNNWGDGSWGDSDSAVLQDQVYRHRFRPHRQKCSVFSVEFSDQSVTNAGFIPSVLALELGIKPGLDRISS